MSSTTVLLDGGPLSEIDLVAVGAASGLLWRSREMTLVGLGSTARLQLQLGEPSLHNAEDRLRTMGSSQDHDDRPGSGPIGFVTMPFDRGRAGLVLIPETVIGESHGERFVTAPHGTKLLSVAEQVRALFDASVRPSPLEVSLHLERAADSWRDEVVAVARDRIADSDLKKAVLARALTLRASSEFPLDRIVTSLADQFGEAMVFSIDGFVGASPELLVSRIGRVVRSHPLAGTAARSADPVIDAERITSLLTSTKDRVEHQITIDWLLSELLPFCSYVDAEPEPSTMTLTNVHHLGTSVEGVLSEPAASILDLVDAVHPTPALGGAPQEGALALIEQLEGFDRHRYGGPSGWIDAFGNGEFAVSVRTAQVRGTEATVAAGVGVVAQSDPQAELEETQAKLRAMLETFLTT